MPSKEQQQPDILVFLGIGLSGVGVALLSVTPFFLVLTAVGVVLIVVGLIRTRGVSSAEKR